MRRRVLVVDAIALALSTLALVWACWPESYALRRISDTPSPTERIVAGCWRFDKGADLVAERVPTGAVVELRDSIDTRWGSDDRAAFLQLRVLPLNSVDARSVRLSGWGPDSADDDGIQAWIGDGFSGLRFHLRLRDSLLSGTVRRYTDMWPDFGFRHSVRARRVACAPSF